MTSRSSFGTREARSLVALLACALAACSTTREGPSVSDTTTNWLQACKRNADCRGESSCLAGTCTIACSPKVDSVCSALAPEAECVDIKDAPAHCDLPCRFDRACDSLGDGYACNQGVCRPESEVVREEKEQSQPDDMDASVSPTRPPAPPFDSSPVIFVDSGFPDSFVFAVDAGEIDAGVGCFVPSDSGFAPPVIWQPPAWEPFVSDAGRDELFKIVKETFVGRWHGLATTSWTSDYLVDIEFKADGHYSSRCSDVMEPCCRAFNDGTDQESELKQYTLLDAQASGYVIGDIDLVYWDGTKFYPSGSQGKLSYVERDRSGNGLRLRYGTDSTPRVRFDLRRVNAQ